MTFEKFNYNWEDNFLNEPKYIRRGQSLMNYLFKVWKPEYDRITSGYYFPEENIDCFYINSFIPNTLKHLEKVWWRYPN